jgi:arylsulfatase A-like enzyme
MPTSLELAGLEVPKSIEFKSLLPLLNESRSKHYSSIYGGFKGIQRSITKDNWKLIYYTYANKYRLYNLKVDPLEMQDQSSNPSESNRLKKMKKELIELSRRLNDPLDYNAPEESWSKISKK